MPVIDGIGVSDYTIYKQIFFQNFLADYTVLIWRKKAWRRREASQYLYYFDMSAGPGAYYGPNGIILPGSPILFAVHACHSRLPFRAVFCEADPLNCARLAYNTRIALTTPNQLEMSETLVVDTNVPDKLKSYFSDSGPGVLCIEDKLIGPKGQTQDKSSVYVRNASSYTSIAKNIAGGKGKWFGFMYIDPNGVDVSFETLARLRKQKKFRGIDFLINLAAGTYKKVRCNPSTRLTVPLEDALRSVPNTAWYVTAPFGNHQWVMLFGTYCVDRPPRFDDWGLFNIDRAVGKQLMHELSYSEKERARIAPPQGAKSQRRTRATGELNSYKIIRHPISHQAFATKGGEIRYCHPWYRPTRLGEEVLSEALNSLGMFHDMASGWIFSAESTIAYLTERKPKDKMRTPEMIDFAADLWKFPEQKKGGIL